MEGKKIFLTDKVFCLCSLAYKLRHFVHPSVDVYMAKNSGHIHITSCVDLECLHYQIFNIVNYHLFSRRSFRYVSDPSSVQQNVY